MKVVYIASGQPIKKVNKKEGLKEAALLLASQLRNTPSSRKRAERIMEIELE